LFRLSGDRWRRISTADGLRHDVVLSVAASTVGEIWVGYWYSDSVTRIRMDGEHLSMTHYGAEAGLRGEMRYFLGFDAHGQLWVGTDQGVRVSQDGVHILRHTFCSHLAMRGAPPRAIQELAGHRELGMTQRYMHLSPAALDSAIRLLDQPLVLQSFGDPGETGTIPEGKING
jgi:ligand-binding sensor domain-containing protein